MATSTYLPCNEPTDLKSVKPRTGPSGYLKVKGQVENASITAVKRQLGSLYRQNGPSLRVEFDPLPPGAFESSVQTPVDDPEYAGEPAPDLTPDFTKVYTQSNSCLLLNNAKEVPNIELWNTNTTQKNPVGCNYKFMAKHDGAEIKTSPGPSDGFRSPCVGKVNREQVKPRFTSCNEVSLKIMEEKDLECKPSNFIRKGSKHRYCPERELSSKVEKDYIHLDRPAVDEIIMKIPGIKK